MISDRQRLACQLLASGQTGRQVAHAIGIHESTLSNWRRVREFQTALSNAQAELIGELRCRLLQAADTAITNLVRVSGQDNDLASSVQASKTILSNCRLIPESAGGLAGAELATGSPEDLPEHLQAAISEIECHLAGGESTEFVRYLEASELLEDDPLQALLSDMTFLGNQLACWQAEREDDHETG